MADAEPAITTLAPARRPRRRRWLLAIVVGGLVSATTAELFLRVRYGLGSPVLLISDTATEYRPLPNQHLTRLGNRIDYNAHSMRSDDFPERKSDARERRVLMIGDSIINGGNQTDQSRLASALLQQRLAESLGTPVVVANISAGSWGPQNQLAYLQKFGSFDADEIVLVVSSHDATDEIGPLPTEEKLISKRYWLALGEALDRARMRFGGGTSGTDPMPVAGRAEPCLRAFEQMIELAKSAAGRPPIVVFHYERDEIMADVESPGHSQLRAVCARNGIEPISLRDAYRAAHHAGREPFRDHLHPNEAGQQAIADVLAPTLTAALRDQRSDLAATTTTSTRKAGP